MKYFYGESFKMDLQKKISNDPYWWEHVLPMEQNRKDWPAHADAVIVGSGYTGLSTAISLLNNGFKVVVIDKANVGYGASSRNGGITSGRIKPSYSKLSKRFGNDMAKNLINEGKKAREDLNFFIKSNEIDCDLSKSGMFIGSTSKKGFDNQKREVETLFNATGVLQDVIKPNEVEQFIVSPKYQGGIFDKHVGSIQPSKLLRSMVDIVFRKKGFIFSGVEFKDSEKINGCFHVFTNKGSIKTKHLVIATNAYTDQNLPWLRKRLVPIISEMLATETLGENKIRSLMPKLSTFGENLNLFYYFRPSPDGKRILIGGRRIRYNQGTCTKKLLEGLLGIFPDLINVNVSHHWYGYVAFPFDQLPKLVMHKGVIYAAGYCGSGTVWAHWLGKKAAEIILNFEEISPFYNITFKSMPLYSGNPWFVPIAIQYFKLQDWWRNQ